MSRYGMDGSNVHSRNGALTGSNPIPPINPSLETRFHLSCYCWLPLGGMEMLVLGVSARNSP
jgi:hypothetical protein